LPPESDLAAVDMLDEVRMGLNVINLRRARPRLPADSQEKLNRLLGEVAAHYQAQADAGRPLLPPTELLVLLDAALSRLRVLASGAGRDEALLGLIGLRHGLFSEPSAADVAPPVLAGAGA